MRKPSVYVRYCKNCQLRSTPFLLIFYFDFGDRNWRQAEAWNLLLAEVAEVNALAQGAQRRFTQWPLDRTPNLPIGRRTVHHAEWCV